MLDGKAVVNAPGVPSIGQSHPNFRNLRVVNKSAGPGLAERIVSVRYQWMQGGWTPGQNDDDVFSKTPRIQWGISQRTEVTDTDVYGNVICNSAGDVFSNLPSKTLFSLTLRITRWERKFDVFRTRQYVNKVNLNKIVAGDVTFGAGSMLCTFIAPVAEFVAGAEAVQMGYDFEIRPTVSGDLPKTVSENPFAFWTMDTGLRSFQAGKNDPMDLYYATDKTKQVTQDVRLDGFGAPVNASDYVTVKDTAGAITYPAPTKNLNLPTREYAPVKYKDGFALSFDIYERIDFLGLGL